jgi:hypothetical protein
VLTRLGIDARAERLAQGLTGAALESHRAAHRRLTHPAEMGSLFKVLAITSRRCPATPRICLMPSTLEIITSDALDARHGFFTRKGGASSGIFAGLNCGTGSSDQTEIVAINRARVAEAMGVGPEALVTVHQVHSARALPVTGPLSIRPEADALVTATPGVLLAVLTADCQPVLFSDSKGEGDRGGPCRMARRGGWRAGSHHRCDGDAWRATVEHHRRDRPDDQPGRL